MATLKSIKNKYLQASDGTALGVTTNTENIAALSFKLATADSLSKFNLVDGFADDYNDSTGVDSGNSTNDERDSTDNYYKGVSGVTTSGWDSQITDGLYTIEAFTDTGASTYITDTAQTYDYLIVGGGGSGGGHGGGGGGGGGGLNYQTSQSLAAGSFSVVVGDGDAGSGQGGYSSPITWQGENSTFNDGSTTFTGGYGGGGSGGSQGGSGNDAPLGSGGGASGVGNTNPGGSSGSQGSGGGNGTGGSPNYAGGGGGGAGGGGSGGSTHAGPGGNGSSNSITGSAVTYGGGGGGGSHFGSEGRDGGTGGTGGGGDGCRSGIACTGTAGTANTGGGGGGGGGREGSIASSGGLGGSGVVYLRHLTAGAPGALTLQSTAFTAQSDPTTARIIMEEWAFTGAQTLNTDIKAYASRDGGTTFTQATLSSQGYLLNQGGINGNTEGMLHCDGSDGGTTFTDSCTEGGNTAKTWTASGNAHTSTDQFKFGTASAQFDGTGDYISTPATTDWDFGSDDFTIDFWIRPGVVDALQRVFGNLNSGGSSSQFEFQLGSNNTMNFSGSGFSPALSVGNTAELSINTWYHVAITRNGTNFRLFVNGTAGSTFSQSTAMGANTTTSIGRSGGWTSHLYTGYVDEVRITKGVALWTANFTPPTQSYATSRRLLSGSVDISGQPSGTDMKYKITTHNQSTALATRVYGTSMAWA